MLQKKEEVKAVIKLWDKGFSIQNISLNTGLSREYVKTILNTNEVITKKENLFRRRKENFLKNDRNKKILDEWNKNDSSTLSSIGQKYLITRERIRQILSKAKALEFKVVSRSEKEKKRRDYKLDMKVKKYKERFIDLYSSQNKSPREISNILGLSDQDSLALEEFFIKSGEIIRPLSRARNKVSSEITERRKIILQYKTEKRTIKEISILTGFSIPTVMNDIFQMKKQGILVPNSRNSGGSLSEAELEFRKGFIEEKIQEGWTKTQIAKGLGLADGAAISHFIRKFM